MDLSTTYYLPTLSASTGTQVTNFEYIPLQPRCIRLLSLKRGPSPEHLISGSLSPISLDDCQLAFVALSYAWGEPTPTHTIAIDGKPFAIVKNLYEFLVRTPRSNNSIPFWIDALCIDQNNLDERKEQVKLMKEVYARTSMVEIWLGEASDDSDAAFDLMRSLYPILDGFGRPEKVRQLSEEPATTPRSSAWLALGKLMDRSWFSRIWVVQEVALADEIDVICGNQLISWDVLESVVLDLIRHDFTSFAITVDSRENRDDRLQTHSVPHGWRMVSTMKAARQHIQLGETIDIEIALRSFHSFQASDPRDKIYGILVIAGLKNGLIIEPDYSISTEELYTSLTYRIIRNNCSLGLLSMAGIGWTRSISGLPSWTPDYANSAGNEWDLRTWAASKSEGLTLKFGRTVEPKRLWLSGFIIDVVTRMGSVHSPCELGFWDWFLEAEEQFYKPRVNDDAFWKTLCANKHNEGDDGVRADDYIFPFPLRYCFDSFKSLYRSEKDAYTATEIYCAGLFRSALSRASLDRRLCCTRGGRMGLVPRGAKAGDIVCVVYGGHTPILIRPVEGSGDKEEHQYVGTCCVHGIMDGEVFTLGLNKQSIALI